MQNFPYFVTDFYSVCFVIGENKENQGLFGQRERKEAVKTAAKTALAVPFFVFVLDFP